MIMKISLVQARCMLRVIGAETTPAFRCQPNRRHTSDSDEGKEMVNINWKNRDGSITATKAAIGSNLLSVARKYEIELEGACEGVCACSTCHIILEDSVFDSLPDPTEDEEDMLDQAFGLTATSRLGCQFCVSKAHEGILVKLPSATRNFYVDGHTPKPH